MQEIEVNMDKLSEEQKSLAEVTGIEIYKEIVRNFGGSCIYISKPDTLTQSERNAEMRKRFNGRNYRELARRYNLSENRVRAILRDRKSW